MSRRCPSSIKLMGYKIPIVFSDDMDECWGEWDGDKFTITISDEATDIHKKVTFLHEVLHGIDSILGLDIPHKTVYAVSQALFLLIEENPELGRWLVGPDKFDHSSN